MKHPVSVSGFMLMLLLTVYFILHTAPLLPPLVASHFDAGGDPNAFVARSDYVRGMLWLSLGLPVVVVGLLTVTYSRSSNFKLPHRDHWLAPERLGATRSLLIGHGVWFGTLFAAMMCFVHWLILRANRQSPPHLSVTLIIAGVLAFILLTVGWGVSLLFVFRRPSVRYRT